MMMIIFLKAKMFLVPIHQIRLQLLVCRPGFRTVIFRTHYMPFSHIHDWTALVLGWITECYNHNLAMHFALSSSLCFDIGRRVPFKSEWIIASGSLFAKSTNTQLPRNWFYSFQVIQAITSSLLASWCLPLHCFTAH